MYTLPDDIIYYLMHFSVYNLLIRTCKKFKKIGESRYLIKIINTYPTFKESKYIIQNELETYNSTYIYFIDIKNNIHYTNTLTYYNSIIIGTSQYLTYNTLRYKSRQHYLNSLFKNNDIKMFPKLYFKIMEYRKSAFKIDKFYNYTMTLNYIKTNFENCNNPDTIRIICQDSHCAKYYNNIITYSIDLLLDKYRIPNPPKINKNIAIIKHEKKQRPAAIAANEKIKKLNHKSKKSENN